MGCGIKYGWGVEYSMDDDEFEDHAMSLRLAFKLFWMADSQKGVPSTGRQSTLISFLLER